MRPSRVLLFLASAALLPACGLPFTDDTIVCTDVFIASTRITVMDSQGELQDDVRVTFRRDGGAEEEAWCRSSSVERLCQVWETPDKGGEYVIRATSADGLRSAEQRVEVEADECHVEQTVPVEFVLPD